MAIGAHASCLHSLRIEAKQYAHTYGFGHDSPPRRSSAPPSATAARRGARRPRLCRHRRRRLRPLESRRRPRHALTSFRRLTSAFLVHVIRRRTIRYCRARSRASPGPDLHTTVASALRWSRHTRRREQRRALGSRPSDDQLGRTHLHVSRTRRPILCRWHARQTFRLRVVARPRAQPLSRLAVGRRV